jgi:serine/threonine-protein kinase
VSAVIEQLRAVINERYVVEREIGHGGMAIVYLARDLKLNQPVAIKVLNTDVSVVLGAERFKREIQVTTLLSHPNVLPIYDSGLAGSSLYYVMQYVEGESLRARLDRERCLPIADAIRITCEIASALEQAHAHGIIHRDIKPENILLDDDQAMLSDFGIAHAMTDAGEQRLTQTGMSLGTPTYMSPEQATAERTIDGRSDVYSLACVTYEMLGGQPPFTGPTAQAIIARHTLETVPSLTIIRNTVPPEIEAVLVKALAKVPADRYASAREFADALRHPETQTYLVPSPPKRRGSRRLARWHKVALGAAAVAVVAGGYAAWRNRPGVVSSAGALAGPEPSRIAVLYFADESKDKTLGYLATGLTDALIDRLSAIPQLQVSSRNASALFESGNVPRDSIARALNVGTLVDGSIEQHGDKISVTVKLDDATGSDFRRTTFDVPIAAPLALQDTLATRVAMFLRERLGQEVDLRAERAGTAIPAAWTMLQRAKLLTKLGDSARTANDTAGMLLSFARADSMLAAAQNVDPNWAAVPILRGTIAYLTSRFYSGDQLRAGAWIDTGLAHAARALEIAPRNADAFELRGSLRYWRWLMATEPDPTKAQALLDAARKDLETATQISPNEPEAWSILSHLYYQYDDVVSAKLAARRAYDEDAYLSDADLVVWRLFTTSYDLEQFPDAIHWCDVGAGRFAANPRFVECKLWLMATTAVTPNVANAWAMADSLVKLSAAPDRPYERLNGTAMVAGAIARAGLKDSAAHMLDRLDDRADVDPTKDVTQTIALTWVVLGNTDKAIKSLALYLSANPARAVGFDDEHSWEWRSIHDDPRFQALVVKPKK